MAVGYFMAHASKGNPFLPILNQGDAAVLNCSSCCSLLRLARATGASIRPGGDQRTGSAAQRLKEIVKVVNARPRLVTALVAATGAAVAMTAYAGPEGEFQIKLNASLRNQGETAWAVFASNGDRTSMVLTLSGVPDYLVRPVRLYTDVYRGSCGQRPVSPAFELNQVVVPIRQPAPRFMLNKSLPLTIARLRSGDYSVVVRSSLVDGNIDLFCGDIG
jgi:hypothetical protein